MKDFKTELEKRFGPLGQLVDSEEVLDGLYKFINVECSVGTDLYKSKKSYTFLSKWECLCVLYNATKKFPIKDAGHDIIHLTSVEDIVGKITLGDLVSLLETFGVSSEFKCFYAFV